MAVLSLEPGPIHLPDEEPPVVKSVIINKAYSPSLDPRKRNDYSQQLLDASGSKPKRPGEVPYNMARRKALSMATRLIDKEEG